MATGRKTLSIVMATYNGARYIEQQLQSLSNQTVLPDEIIISDDNSDDGTFDIIEDFKKNSGIQVKTIRRVPGLGFRDNFLHTSLEARGDFIAFCDQDDVWRSDKIEICSKYFDDNNVSMIVHQATTIDGSSNPIGEFRQNINSTVLKSPLSYDPWGTFWGFSIVYRRELLSIVSVESRFRDYISPQHLIAHDRWITFLGQLVGATAEVDECLVGYRQHDANLFGQGSGGKIRTTTDLVERTDLYIEVTRQMLSIIHSLDDQYEKIFPLYNKENCIEFFERAMAQLQARKEIYAESSKLKALLNAGVALSRKTYTNVHDDKFRWKSLVSDVRFIALRT